MAKATTIPEIDAGKLLGFDRDGDALWGVAMADSAGAGGNRGLGAAKAAGMEKDGTVEKPVGIDKPDGATKDGGDPITTA